MIDEEGFDPFDIAPTGQSNIVVELIEGDDYRFVIRVKELDVWMDVSLGVEFGVIEHEGHDAYWEDYGGMLDESVAELILRYLEIVDGIAPGWYYIENFTAKYSTDYWGETDCEVDCDRVRLATTAEIEYFCGKDCDVE